MPESFEILRGRGTINKGWELVDAAALLETGGVRKDDIVDIAIVCDNEIVTTISTKVAALRDNQSCLLGVYSHPKEPPYDCDFTVRRVVDKPCPICKKDLSDHKHCWSCEELLSKEHPKAHCESCLDITRLSILSLGLGAYGVNPYEETVSILGGRRTAIIRTRTLEEADRVTEEQERMMLMGGNDFSIDVMQAQVRLMTMGYAIVQDGDVRIEDTLPPARDPKTNEVVPGMKEDTPDLRSRYFSALRRMHYDTLEKAVQVFDVRFAEACAVEILDELTDEELMAIADHRATAKDPYYGTINALGGAMPITFSETFTRDEMEVKRFLAAWQRENDFKMTEFRYNAMSAVVRLASVFRADLWVDFDEDSTLIERCQYVLGLPLDLYYHYSAAAGVFNLRLVKSGELLKNS